MIPRRAVPPITTAPFFPPPAATFLDPDPLATLIVPLSAGDRLGRKFESVLVAVLGNSVADNYARITNGPRNSQHFEITLGKIAERVEVVHFVFDKKKSVLGIVGRSGGAHDHAGGVCAIAGDAVCGAGVAAKRSEIGNSEAQFGIDMTKTARQEGYEGETDFGLDVHGRVVLRRKLRVSEKNFRAQAQI
jgi:hypothetical protein